MNGVAACPIHSRSASRQMKAGANSVQMRAPKRGERNPALMADGAAHTQARRAFAEQFV